MSFHARHGRQFVSSWVLPRFGVPSPASASAAEGRFGETGPPSPIFRRWRDRHPVASVCAGRPRARWCCSSKRPDCTSRRPRRGRHLPMAARCISIEHTQRRRLWRRRVSVCLTAACSCGRRRLRLPKPAAAFARVAGSAARVTASANNRDVLVRVVEGDARIESSWGRRGVASTQSGVCVGTNRPAVREPGYAAAARCFHQWSNWALRGVAPPPFLPYAHPDLSAAGYSPTSGCSVRGDHDRKRPEVHQRADVGATRLSETTHPAAAEPPGATTDADRRRSDRPAPAAKRAAPAARGAGQGRTVRRP